MCSGRHITKIVRKNLFFGFGGFFGLFIYLFIYFIGLQLLYNVVLVSTVQQSELAVCVHITPLFWLSFLFRSPQSTE